MWIMAAELAMSALQINSLCSKVRDASDVYAARSNNPH